MSTHRILQAKNFLFYVTHFIKIEFQPNSANMEMHFLVIRADAADW